MEKARKAEKLLRPYPRKKRKEESQQAFKQPKNVEGSRISANNYLAHLFKVPFFIRLTSLKEWISWKRFRKRGFLITSTYDEPLVIVKHELFHQRADQYMVGCLVAITSWYRNHRHLGVEK